MNKKIHQLATTFLLQGQFDYRTIQFDQLIESVDPQLRRLITMMTAPKKVVQQKPPTLHDNIKKSDSFTVCAPYYSAQSLLHVSSCPTHRCH